MAVNDPWSSSQLDSLPWLVQFDKSLKTTEEILQNPSIKEQEDGKFWINRIINNAIIPDGVSRIIDINDMERIFNLFRLKVTLQTLGKSFIDTALL